MCKRLAVYLVLIVLVLAPSFAAAQTRHFTVVFNAATLPGNARAIVEKAGGTVVDAVPEVGMMTISGPAALLDAFGADRAVAAVGPELILNVRDRQVIDTSRAASFEIPPTADRYTKYQWDIKQVTRNGASFSLAPGSHDTVVGIVDSGVNTLHADLTSNYLGGQNFVAAGGMDRAHPDPLETGDADQVEDRNGHGSHIAGTIAGNGAILGVGPSLGYRAYRVLDADGRGLTSWILKGIVAAVRDRVDVISMSIGGFDLVAGGFWTDPDTGIRHRFRDVPDMLAFRRAVQYATMNGVVVVVSAGNEATNLANPTELTDLLNQTYGGGGWEFIGASRQTPGTTPGVVTVSATAPDYSLASYSNYGPGAIDVTAPGGDFDLRDNLLDGCYSAYAVWNGYTTAYAWMVGTSMAAPKVSAVAALIIDQARADGQRLTPAQVIARLQQTAIDIGKRGADPWFGRGFISAYYALGGK